MFKNLKRQIEAESGSTISSAPVQQSASLSDISSRQGQGSTDSVNGAGSGNSTSPSSNPSASTHSSTVAHQATPPSTSAAQDLQTRYDSMEKAYDAHRLKTADLLAKKDSHIARLQARLDTLEARVTQLSGGGQLHSLLSERDALKERCDKLETTMETDKDAWQTKQMELEATIENLRSQLDTFQRNCACESLRTELKTVKTDLQWARQKTKITSSDKAGSDQSIPDKWLTDRLALLNRLRDDLIHTKRFCIELLQQDPANIDACRELTALYEQLEEYEAMQFDANPPTDQISINPQASEIHLGDKNPQSREKDLRSQLGIQKDECRRLVKERDELLLRNAHLAHEVELVKRDNRQADVNTHAMVEQLQQQVRTLEAQLRDRNSTISSRDQNRIHHSPRDRDRFSPKGSSLDETNFQYMRNVLFRYITASDHEAVSLVKAVSTLLRLNESEERLVRHTLNWKQSWLPVPKPTK